MRAFLVGVVTLLGLAACATGSQIQRQPVSATDGLALSGQLAGRTVSVSDGEPEVIRGDCDPPDGRDTDLCIVSFTIDGAPLGLVIENPDALEGGVTLDVAGPAPAGCVDQCDRVTDQVVIELRRGTERQFARGGTITVTEAGPRYAGRVTLEFEGGTLTGTFNVQSGPPPGDTLPPAVD